MNNMKEIKTELKKRRKELGLTMKEVAELVGVSEATISRWESGNIANMRRDRITKLAQALRISPAVIMGWDLDTKNDETGFFASAQGPLWNQCLEACDYDEAAAAVMYKNMKDEIEEEAMQESANSASLFEAAAGEARHTEWYSSEGYNISLEADEVAVRVVGRSMEPTLLDGDVVIVCAQSVIDYPRQIALVKVNGDDATIKRVEIKENGVMLIGDNTNVYAPHFYSAEEVEQLPVRVEGVVTKLIRDIE